MSTKQARDCWGLLGAIALIGCTSGGGSKDSASDTAGAADGGSADGADGSEGGADDGGGDGGGDGGNAYPEGPVAFTLTTTGDSALSLSFSEPDCPYRASGTSFRQTWRGDGHVFVLIVEVSRDFPGTPGTYGAAGTTRVRLQEEAGGSLTYYDSTLGDGVVEVTLDGFSVDDDRAWGSFSAGALGGSAGERVEIGPQPLPIWCPTLL